MQHPKIFVVLVCVLLRLDLSILTITRHYSIRTDGSTPFDPPPTSKRCAAVRRLRFLLFLPGSTAGSSSCCCLNVCSERESFSLRLLVPLRIALLVSYL